MGITGYVTVCVGEWVDVLVGMCGWVGLNVHLLFANARHTLF